MIRRQIQQVEVAQKLYGIYKTLESVIGKIPELDKAGIASVSLSVRPLIEENKDFVRLLVSEFDRVKLNLRSLQLGSNYWLEMIR